MPRTYKAFAVSMEPGLYKRARARAARLHFRNSFSAYVQKLIEEDLERERLKGKKSPDNPPPIENPLAKQMEKIA